MSIKRVLPMVPYVLGYMTAWHARKEGFTHYGSYYGIPVWLGNMDDPNGMLVATKWYPMELLMTVAHHIEGTLRPLLYPDEPAMFQFKVFGEITPTDTGGSSQ